MSEREHKPRFEGHRVIGDSGPESEAEPKATTRTKRRKAEPEAESKEE